MRSTFTAESVLAFTERSSFRENYETLLCPALAAVQLTTDSEVHAPAAAASGSIAAEGDYLASQTTVTLSLVAADVESTDERKESSITSLVGVTET